MLALRLLRAKHKLIYTLLCLQITPTLKIVHRRGADRAQNYFALIEHRELDGHSTEVVAMNLPSLQRHRKYSMLDGSLCHGRWVKVV